jgi:UPF0755 protein
MRTGQVDRRSGASVSGGRLNSGSCAGLWARRLNRRTGAVLYAVIFAVVLTGCGRGEGEGEPVRINVPPGASFNQVADSLAAHDIVRAPPLFKIYARMRGAAGRVQPGTYAFRPNTSWQSVVDDLTGGRVLNARVVIPEAWDLRGIAPRIAATMGFDADSVMYVLTDTATVERFGVPGPTMEGYLYPATYTFPLAMSLDSVIGRMVATYRRVWTEERRARAEEMGMSEREVVTMASIIEKEARQRDEMPRISGVYHNRLRRNWRLEADPTVQYALGEHQARLLYAHIDQTADNPYNTYRNFGLPPGPIGSPSALGIDAALNPEQHDLMFFVARPDGSHIFTRTLDEHNRARVQVRRMQEQQAGARQQQPPGQMPADQQPGQPSPR